MNVCLIGDSLITLSLAKNLTNKNIKVFNYVRGNKKKSNTRSFGILFCIVFLLIAIWPLISSNHIRYWAIILSITFLILGIVNSKLLSPLKDYWIKLGEILGKVIAPIVMSLVFFIILTPIGIILRIFGKDLLKLKKNKKSSYWLSRGDLKSMDRQF